MKSDYVTRKFGTYPKKAKAFAERIRSLIYSAAEQEGIVKIEESLKWGEPSFKAPGGSPVRIDWKADTPDKFYIFFNCRTVLVDTIRRLYGKRLQLQGNRAIVLDLSSEIPAEILKHCFSMALKYHRIRESLLRD